LIAARAKQKLVVTFLHELDRICLFFASGALENRNFQISFDEG
jgi:hypothetical protein